MPIDNGRNGTVDLGAANQMPEEPEEQATGGTTVCITIQGDQITVEKYPAGEMPTGEGEPMELGDALKMIVDLADGAETEENPEANFETGFKSRSGEY